MNNSLTLIAPAKLNLFLKVLNQTSNGYHTLKSFIVFINLYDTLTFTLSSQDNESKVNFADSSNPFLVNLLKELEPQANIILKVINYMISTFNLPKNLQVELNKHIPLGGGLGGGSSNAATTLIAINHLYKLHLSDSQLIKLASNFGADMALCLQYYFNNFSGLLVGTGHLNNPNDSFTEYKLNFTLPILIVNPNIQVSTQLVFNEYAKQLFAKQSPSQQPSSSQTQNPTNNNMNLSPTTVTLKPSFLDFIASYENDLTSVAESLAPDITLILNLLSDSNARIVRMSGSGSTCFAIYNSQKDLIKAEQSLNFKLNQLNKKYLVYKSNSINKTI